MKFSPIKKTGFLLSVATCALWSGFALAQTSGTASSPAQIEKRIDEQRQRPPEELRPGQGVVAPAVPLPSGEKISFVLSAVIIEGATAFEPAELAALYRRYLATPVTEVEIREIAKAVTKLYQDAGYIFSQADALPQDVVDGVLTLRVTEGYVERIEVEGLDVDDPRIAGYFDAVLAERPVRLETIERALLLTNDLSGVALADSKVADGATTGAKVLKLRFDTKDYNADVYLDNRGTPSSGRLQTWLSGSANGILTTGDQLRLGFFTVPDAPQELLYGSARWTQPLGRWGTTAELALSASKVNAGDYLADSDTESKSRRIHLTLRHPVMRSRNQSLWAIGELDYYDLSEDRNGTDNYEDRNRFAVLGVEYYRPSLGNGDIYAKWAYTRGLDVLGASNPGNGLLSRSDGKAVFDKVTLELRRLQKIWGGLGLFVQAKGQWSNQPLLTGAEFSLGGSQYGRAYDYGELVGDSGAGALAELRYTGKKPVDWVSSYDLYVFYDGGVVWNDGGARQTLTSVGGGVRTTVNDLAYADIQVAKPLNRNVSTESDDDLRVLFALGASF